MSKIRCLNLGCGDNIIGHAVNVDIRQHRPQVDVICDLNNLPWPWPDGSFDHIVAKAIFEHLRLTLLEAMNEAWRLMSPHGFIEVKLPYWKHEVSYNTPDHRYVAGLGIFEMLDPSTDRGKQYPWYTDRKWSIRRVGLNQGGTSVYGVLDVIKARKPR